MNYNYYQQFSQPQQFAQPLYQTQPPIQYYQQQITAPAVPQYLPDQTVIPDRYKSFAELESALKLAGIDSIQMMFAFDFSRSNEWSGQKSIGHHMHALLPNNPYIQVLNVLAPILPNFDDDGIYPAFRFGCSQTRDQGVLPLQFPIQDPHYEGIPNLIAGYQEVAKQLPNQLQLSGPTTFSPIIKKAVEICQAYGGRQLIFVLILTDGDVSNLQLDQQMLKWASQWPISFCAVGLGDGPFDKMKFFDDMPGRKFDNFQFVDFTGLNMKYKFERQECPEVLLATEIFQELPEQFKAMKRLGML